MKFTVSRSLSLFLCSAAADTNSAIMEKDWQKLWLSAENASPHKLENGLDATEPPGFEDTEVSAMTCTYRYVWVYVDMYNVCHRCAYILSWRITTRVDLRPGCELIRRRVQA